LSPANGACLPLVQLHCYVPREAAALRRFLQVGRCALNCSYRGGWRALNRFTQGQPDKRLKLTADCAALIITGSRRQLSRRGRLLHMERRRNWHPTIFGTLLGVIVTPPFFFIYAITTYHADLGVAELLFPYSVIISRFSSEWVWDVFVSMAVQWPLYGFVGGLAYEKRPGLYGRWARLVMVALIIGHLAAAFVAYSPL
jgi:hypothetical protein